MPLKLKWRPSDDGPGHSFVDCGAVAKLLVGKWGGETFAFALQPAFVPSVFYPDFESIEDAKLAAEESAHKLAVEYLTRALALWPDVIDEEIERMKP